MPNYTPEEGYPDLSNLSFEEMYHLRKLYEGNQDMQNYLGPYEHQAFTRGVVSEQPYGALPMMAMIPGYELKKTITGEGRSDPSLRSMAMGYKGVFQGLLDYLAR